MPTPNLSLTPLSAAQSQKHVTVNEALARLDAAVQLAVLDRTHSAPVASPVDGERYLIGPSPSGAWTAKEGAVAAWDEAAQGWQILTPRTGWRVWVIAEQLMLVYDGTSWNPLSSSQIGVNTSADTTNRLSVASDAVLLTHDGGGMQAKLNKAGAADTASLLFQSNYIGHAEIGLAGDNDLHIKTSADGATFSEAMVVDAATGEARFPAGAVSKGVSISADLLPNCLPDSGRFASTETNAEHLVSTFVAPPYMRTFNGSTFAPHARFIHDNTSNGGSRGVLDPEVEALDSMLRPPSHRRYGIEWWAMKFTAGTGTAAASAVGGVTRHTALLGITSPIPAAYTVGYYLRVLSGSAFVDQLLTSRFVRWGVDETGNDLAGVVTPSDGWVFFERQLSPNDFGYNFASFRVYLEAAGNEALIAMPRVVFGHVDFDPYRPGPLPNMRFFG